MVLQSDQSSLHWVTVVHKTCQCVCGCNSGEATDYVNSVLRTRTDGTKLKQILRGHKIIIINYSNKTQNVFFRTV